MWYNFNEKCIINDLTEEDTMPWDTDLYEEQKLAASYNGTHACLRAGPGTGKTLTLCRRIVYLVTEQKIPSSRILVLTFTRSAAKELRKRLREELQPPLPRISTLHSFALRQLLRNSDVVTSLHTPVRIADDWEERNVILEDLKNVLGTTIKEMRTKFHRLSADWETLNADSGTWEQQHPDPAFLGAWRQHSQVYGYTLRSQLVYELKRALQNTPDFELEHSFSYLLVDEYQDLNKCDLAVIKQLTTRGAELFAAGDDDQSIYGFRFAYPEGIRKFTDEYPSGKLLDLPECRRCDKKILDIGQFVANLDPARNKVVRPKDDAADGLVFVLNFNNQEEEALGISIICQHIIESGRYPAEKILLLIRSDFRHCFSEPLVIKLQGKSIPVACKADNVAPLDTDIGREFLNLLRLSSNPQDHLSWRTLLGRRNGIGPQTIDGIFKLSLTEGIKFSEALGIIKSDPNRLPKFGTRVAEQAHQIDVILTQFKSYLDNQSEELPERISDCATIVINDVEVRSKIIEYFREAAASTEANSLTELLSVISVSMEDKEQVTEQGKVNVLTMHQAKGLTADVVFIVAAEDEYVPGSQIGPGADDERRLLYVSLTRAQHELYITYCRQRDGFQMYTGRTSGKVRRTLTRFLRDSPIKPINGIDFALSLQK